MNQLIRRLPLTWQSPANQVVDYALKIAPIEYLVNAVVVPVVGVILLGIIIRAWALLLAALIVFSGLNLAMAAVVALRNFRRINRRSP